MARGGRVVERGGEMARTAIEMGRRHPFPFVVAGMTLLAVFAARAAGRRH
jgi:hypothetical protein